MKRDSFQLTEIDDSGNLWVEMCMKETMDNMKQVSFSPLLCMHLLNAVKETIEVLEGEEANADVLDSLDRATITLSHYYSPP